MTLKCWLKSRLLFSICSIFHVITQTFWFYECFLESTSYWSWQIKGQLIILTKLHYKFYNTIFALMFSRHKKSNFVGPPNIIKENKYKITSFYAPTMHKGKRSQSYNVFWCVCRWNARLFDARKSSEKYCNNWKWPKNCTQVFKIDHFPWFEVTLCLFELLPRVL